MTVVEYNARWAVILKHLGGSLDAPACWAPTGNYHYFSGRLQVLVPHPEALSEQQRIAIINRAETRYMTGQSGSNA